jgi:hypothetical protein
MPALIRLRIDGEGSPFMCVGYFMHSQMMTSKRTLEGHH